MPAVTNRGSSLPHPCGYAIECSALASLVANDRITGVIHCFQFAVKSIVLNFQFEIELTVPPFH